ncbi:MAG: hypothetical protein KDB96_17200 [Flavobacteriales bacterium]|nr:hypothetical protein [Flavobacteriales bacterium]MCB0787374.1 hypothetical protein [Flavobacteriales bacterium]MCB0811017.1 hypothetical protein [Flavobacteriales bacterium]MCB0814868.1 hypothetical protein [Flavobacteriales bacterium]
MYLSPLRTLLGILAFLCLRVGVGQNLVPNGSFEDTVDCYVTTQCRLLKAVHWRNPNLATPDLYDCDTVRVCGAPMTPDLGLAYQPSLDGSRHAGAFFWYGPGGSNTREYLMVRLTDPLEPGATYEVSLSYSRRRFYHQLAVDHIGVWFGADSLFEPHPNVITATPQVRLTDPIEDHLTVGGEWVQLSDTFVAEGGERWMVIGNFDPPGSVDGIVVEPGGISATCYYYIDSVSVSVVAGTDIQELPPTVFWNGNGLMLHLGRLQGRIRLGIWSVNGQLIHSWQGMLNGPYHSMRVPALADGIYLLEAVSGDERRVVRFVKAEGDR